MGSCDLHVLAVVPDVNTTLEGDLRAYCPPDTKLTIARIPRPKKASTADDIPVYVDRSIQTVIDMQPQGVSLAMYGCTSAGFLAGPALDSEAGKRLSGAADAPAVTTASAMVEALKFSGAKSIAVVTPYLDGTNTALINFLAAGGIGVAAIDSFRCPTVDEILQITPAEIFDMALATVTPECDALFIGCVQLPTRDILPELRKRLKMPVWSAAQALAWSGMRKLNLPQADALTAP